MESRVTEYLVLGVREDQVEAFADVPDAVIWGCAHLLKTKDKQEVEQFLKSYQNTEFAKVVVIQCSV